MNSNEPSVKNHLQQPIQKLSTLEKGHIKCCLNQINGIIK